MLSENVQIALMVRYAYIITRQKISTVLGAGNKQGQIRKAEQGSIFRSIKYQSLLKIPPIAVKSPNKRADGCS